jgi:DNA-binding NarL/FixJ family response regulator
MNGWQQLGGCRSETASGSIADAEHEGELRARQQLSGDLLRQVTPAAKRKHDADAEYEQAIGRASRLGLSHREIATAAQVSHGTVRAILTRATTQRPRSRAAVAR